MKKITVNAMGDACPIPVVKTKQAIAALQEDAVIETLVDNEIAVQNLTKMAVQKHYPVKSEKAKDGEFRVEMTVSASDAIASLKIDDEPQVAEDAISQNIVVVFSSKTMGHGDEALGAILIKGFVFALTQMETLPKTCLFYNGGAFLTCEGADTLEDLKSLEAQGVEILTCGTCLNHYGLSDKVAVGGVTNMYDITEKLMHASNILKP